METLYILAGIGLLILQIVMIVKFFQIAKNVRELKRRTGVDKFLSDAEFWYVKGDMQNAYEALNHAFIQDVILLVKKGTPGGYPIGFNQMQKEYESKFLKIGLGQPDYAKYRNPGSCWL